MKFFLNQMGLCRELRLCPESLADKLKAGVITADAVVITGSRQSFVFDLDRLPAMRTAILKTEPEQSL